VDAPGRPWIQVAEVDAPGRPWIHVVDHSNASRA
jgi:hypothetical protein